MNSTELANKIAKLIIKKKGDNIRIFDLKKLTPMTDYFVVCTAQSELQVKAISDFVSEETRKLNQKPEIILRRPMICYTVSWLSGSWPYWRSPRRGIYSAS